MSRLAGVNCYKRMISLGLVLNASFGWGSAGKFEGEEHFSGLFGVELAGGKTGNDHGEGVPDRLCAAQRVKDMAAEAGAGADGGAAGAAELVVGVAEGAGGESGRLAAAAVGFDVAAEGVYGVGGVHGGPFRLNAKGRSECGLLFFNL